MSIRLMASAWQMRGINPGAKLVLLALCDNASDEGVCFPSVRTIAEKCCMAERTVQGHIAAFEAAGLLKRIERPGRSTVYTIDPRRICTHAESAPPQNLHPTPAVSAPITIKEPSGEPSRNQERAQRKRSAAPRAPGDVDPQVWADWLKLRAAKKAPVTETVIGGARSEAVKAGMSLTEFLTEWCARGSQGLKASWLGDRAGAARSQSSPQVSDAQRTAEVRRLLGFDAIDGDVIDGDVIEGGGHAR